jgi:cell shape-determining protein MreC
LKSAFDTYQKLQNTVQNRLSEVQSAILSPVDVIKRLVTQSAGASDEGGELDLLRKRVAELETRLLRNSSPKRRRAAKGPRRGASPRKRRSR